MLKDLKAPQLREQCVEFLKAAEKRRPKALSEDRPEALLAYEGEYADEGIDDKVSEDREGGDSYLPSCGIKVNRFFGDVNALIPYFMARNPKPANRGRKPGTQPYADCFARLKTYSDSKFDARANCRRALMDNLILSIGYLRTDKHPETGVARSLHFDASNVWWDSQANHYKSAQWVIEKHRRSRWKMRKEFGEVVDKLPPDKSLTQVEGEKHFDSEHQSDFDEITYYLLWSKIDNENRVYAFHKTYGEKFLNEVDGVPGEPFPYIFDDDEWHLSPLSIYPVNSNAYGMSYWDAARGVMRFINVVSSAILQASLNAAKTATFVDVSICKEWEKLKNSLDLNPVIICNLTAQQAVAGIDNYVKHIPAGESPKILQEVLGIANSLLNDITGISSITLGNPSNVETAAESVRMGSAAENRIADPQSIIEDWLNSIAYKEAQVNAKEMPRRSTLCWYPLSAALKVEAEIEGEAGEVAPDADDKEYAGANGYAKPPEQAVENSDEEDDTELGRKVRAGGGEIKDVPYEAAILLEAGVGDQDAALRMVTAAQAYEANRAVVEGAGGRMTVEAPTLSPEVAVRQQYKVPLSAEVVILKPGIDGIVGEELAAAWKEKASPRQIKDMVDIAIEVGSTSRMGNVVKQQSAMQAFNALGSIFLQLGLFDALAALISAMIAAMEQEAMDAAKVTGDQIRQGQQEVFNMQANAKAQAEAEQANAKAAQGQQQERLNNQESGLKEQDLRIQQSKNVNQTIGLERDKVRERGKGLTAAIGAAAGGMRV